MVDKRKAEIVLSYQVDTASANRVRQSFQVLEFELGDLRAELTGMGTSAQQGITGLRQRFAQGEQSVVEMQNEVEELRRDLLALDNVTVTPTVDVQDASGTGIRNNNALNTVDRFGRFGTQIAGGFGNSGLGNIVGLVGDVADSFSTLGVVGGAAALSIGAVSLALNEMKRIAEEAAAAQTRLIEGERAGEAQAQNTLQERLARIKEIINLVAAEEASIAERRQEIIDLQTQYANAVGLNGDLIAQFTAGSELQGQITSLETSITNSENALAELSAEFVELNSQLTATKTGAQEFADKGAIALDALLYKVSKGEKGVAATGIQGGIGDGMTSFASMQARMNADLLTTRADAYMDAVTQTVKAQEDLTKAQNAYNEAVAASEARIADINRKLQEDLAQAETQRQDDLADAAREAGEQRVKIEEDTGKERNRIAKRFEKAYAQAVGDRDALAAARAEQQRDEELDQLNDRYKDQLETVDKSLIAQQKTIQARYEAQVKTVRAAADASIRLEVQRAQAELSVRQQSITAAQTQMINAANAELMIRSNLYNQSIGQATVWANTMQMILSYGLSIPGGTGTPKMPTPIIGKAKGGDVQAGVPYLIGEKGPETVVFPRNGTVIPNGAGMNINLNLSGATTETIRAVSRQQALATFGRVLDQMGVA